MDIKDLDGIYIPDIKDPVNRENWYRNKIQHLVSKLRYRDRELAKLRGERLVLIHAIRAMKRVDVRASTER